MIRVQQRPRSVCPPCEACVIWSDTQGSSLRTKGRRVSAGDHSNTSRRFGGFSSRLVSKAGSFLSLKFEQFLNKSESTVPVWKVFLRLCYFLYSFEKQGQKCVIDSRGQLSTLYSAFSFFRKLLLHTHSYNLHTRELTLTKGVSTMPVNGSNVPHEGHKACFRALSYRQPGWETASLIEWLHSRAVCFHSSRHFSHYYLLNQFSEVSTASTITCVEFYIQIFWLPPSWKSLSVHFGSIHHLIRQYPRCLKSRLMWMHVRGAFVFTCALKLFISP